MLLPLTKYIQNYKQMEMHKVWKNGEIIEKTSDYQITDPELFPHSYIIGNAFSQVVKEHFFGGGTPTDKNFISEVTKDELKGFAKRCEGTVYLGTGRIIFEREMAIGFSDENDTKSFLNSYFNKEGSIKSVIIKEAENSGIWDIDVSEMEIRYLLNELKKKEVITSEECMIWFEQYGSEVNDIYPYLDEEFNCMHHL